MTRMVCTHLVPIDMECADCKLEWLGHESEKDAEIARLRKALKSCVSWMPNCSARIDARTILGTPDKEA